jgi:hypothetical protein
MTVGAYAAPNNHVIEENFTSDRQEINLHIRRLRKFLRDHLKEFTWQGNSV